jgi:hypothetical protein
VSADQPANSQTTDLFITLKTWPQYWDALEDGRKTFEIRRCDRPFCVGAVLLLQRWDPEKYDYTYDETGHPKTLARRVTYIMRGIDQFGLSTDYVAMGLQNVD